MNDNKSLKDYKYNLWTYYKASSSRKKRYLRTIVSVIFGSLLTFPLMAVDISIAINSAASNDLGIDQMAFNYASMLIAAFVQLIFGFHYYQQWYNEIFKWHKLGMSSLIGISSSVAFIYSVYLLVAMNLNGSPGTTFFATGASIIAFMNIGHYISERLKHKVNVDVEAVAKLQVGSAFLYNMETNAEKECLVDNIKIGNLLIVKKGAVVPIDGIIHHGSGNVDESLLTGEIKPILKKEGDKVIGGSNNLGDAFIMKTTKLGKDTVLANIVKQVQTIQGQKPKIQEQADKIAKWFTPIIMLLSIFTLLLQGFYGSHIDIPGTGWLTPKGAGTNGTWESAVYYAISVLVIACPCALGIATPLAVAIGSGKGAKNGIIYNKAEAFEKITKIHAIAFDKTGTLTEGKLKVSNFIGDKKNIPFMYSVEQSSVHPLARSFIRYVDDLKMDFKSLHVHLKEIPGVGVIASTHDSDDEYAMTSLNYVREQNYQMDDKLKKELEEAKNNANIQTVIVYSKNKVVLNIVILEDKIRSSAKDTIQLLKDKNIDVYMITGDNQEAAEHIAKALNIEKFYANVKPNGKAEIIKEIQASGKTTAYTGDGINDLIALQQADLSISIGVDNEAARSISDISLVKPDIINIYKALVLTKWTRTMIKINLGWAFGYNIIALPLAILGFIPAMFAVIIMAASDVMLCSNSLLFKMKKIRLVPKGYKRK